MQITYETIDTVPDSIILSEILILHERIFNQSKSLLEDIGKRYGLLFVLAMQGKQVIGYKIGYELNSKKFYSWLGGVDENYRNYGVATKLMEIQHQYLVQNGYKVVQTKTKNKWRRMLILNIKNGFDIIGTYTDDYGEPKIILEKNLI